MNQPTPASPAALNDAIDELESALELASSELDDETLALIYEPMRLAFASLIALRDRHFDY